MQQSRYAHRTGRIEKKPVPTPKKIQPDLLAQKGGRVYNKNAEYVLGFIEVKAIA